MTRTPIEQEIHEQTDRRAKYDKAQREAGLKRMTVWCPIDCESDIRLLLKLLGATNGQYREGLALLVAANFSSGGERE